MHMHLNSLNYFALSAILHGRGLAPAGNKLVEIGKSFPPIRAGVLT